ncbi:hypothetical protein [Streptomyces sp. NPDC016845]|uniref:hypothetical protein n=1 Tax=Streptomyces sp. NPDC016845 TaxID=3364972 RepID=UPI003793B4F5
MSTATYTTAPSGATAATGVHHPHPVGGAARAVRAFASAVFSVVVLGDTDSTLYRDAGVVRRH